MQSSADDPTWKRMSDMAVGGTIAERKFEEHFPYRWVRAGWDGPKWSDGVGVGYALTPIIFALPDYIVDGPDGPVWVEVVGAKGPIVRSLKVDKMQRLFKWEVFSEMPIYIFIWNSSKRRWILVNLLDVPYGRAPVKAFESDGNKYYELQWDDLAEVARLGEKPKKNDSSE